MGGETGAVAGIVLLEAAWGDTKLKTKTQIFPFLTLRGGSTGTRIKSVFGYNI